MNWLRWKKGRQGTGYEKLLIYQFQLFGKGFDCYLLRYKVGDEIPSHTDPVEGKKHFRLNVTLKKAEVGGDLFWYDKKISHFLYVPQKVVLFRSDLVAHKVTRVLKGERRVLTFGAAL